MRVLNLVGAMGMIGLARMAFIGLLVSTSEDMPNSSTHTGIWCPCSSIIMTLSGRRDCGSPGL